MPYDLALVLSANAAFGIPVTVTDPTLTAVTCTLTKTKETNYIVKDPDVVHIVTPILGLL